MNLVGSQVVRLARMLRAQYLIVFDLTGYFDETGIHAEAPVIIVAGYLAEDRQWRRLEIKWNKILNEEGAAFYHILI